MRESHVATVRGWNAPSDLTRAANRCATCEQLRDWDDPFDAAIATVLEARGGQQPAAKEWRMARDVTHLVIELSHDWTRRTVIAVRSGTARLSMS
jgi:hypothetical protein